PVGALRARRAAAIHVRLGAVHEAVAAGGHARPALAEGRVSAQYARRAVGLCGVRARARRAAARAGIVTLIERRADDGVRPGARPAHARVALRARVAIAA